jgi:hypothetical protein
MEYTKGEWKVVHKYNVVVGNRVVASCGGYTSNLKDSDKIVQENITNTNLIAAAPEMYEALKKMVKDWENGDIEINHESKELILKALAKAEDSQ